MIKKTPQGYVIYSEKGKKISRPYKTKGEAAKRLGQIEHFKKEKK